MAETVRVRKWERWVDVALTFSAGSAASMDAAATATGVIDQDVAGAEHMDICASWTYGGAPAAAPVVTVARSTDGGTTFETPVGYSFTDTAAAGVSRRIIWRIWGSDICQVVLTNATGQAITNVAVTWRAVR